MKDSPRRPLAVSINDAPSDSCPHSPNEYEDEDDYDVLLEEDENQTFENVDKMFLND